MLAATTSPYALAMRLAGLRREDLRRALPAVAFFAGFLWDTLTLGRSVAPLDLWLLSGYLAAAAGLLWFLGKRQAYFLTLSTPTDARPAPDNPAPATASPPEWRRNAPYLLLQFLFGGLFSALFIFYFKSSSHFTAYLLVLGLGVLLVANEFLEDRYRRFTLTWLLFGLCAMLLLNFVLPHIVGSLSPFWFVTSTLAGAGLAHGLRHKTPGQPGRIRPVWGAAAALLLAYGLDVIPPVPLVPRAIVVGHGLEKSAGEYRVKLERTPWWQFWHATSNTFHHRAGERLYCVSAIFAPRGLNTRLYHRWQFDDPKQGWVTTSRIGFSLAGGREGGYRGFTWKQNLAPGTWRVQVETEDGRTVSSHTFEVEAARPERDIAYQIRAI